MFSFMFRFGKILIYPTLVIVDVNLTSFCIFLLFQESTLRAEEEMGRGRTKLRYFMVESTRLLLFYAPGWFLFILLTRVFFFIFIFLFRQAGRQIQGVIRSAYKIERQARGMHTSLLTMTFLKIELA